MFVYTRWLTGDPQRQLIQLMAVSHVNYQCTIIYMSVEYISVYSIVILCNVAVVHLHNGVVQNCQHYLERTQSTLFL